jgi:hypothetical protein
MKQSPLALTAITLLVVSASLYGQSPVPVTLKATDGTVLKASYFAAAHPGPGALLLHQINRTRKS